jgi:hypothetical protein
MSSSTSLAWRSPTRLEDVESRDAIATTPSATMIPSAVRAAARIRELTSIAG